MLAAELAKPENWSAEVPTGGQAVVTLAPRRGDLSPRAHPPARCVFVQQAVPLGLAMDRFGDAVVAGPNQFDVEAVTVGGRPLTSVATLTGAQPVREHFARAQFVEVSEDERLTRPAYEPLDAGVEFTSAGFDVSTRPVRMPMSFETRYLDLETGEIRPEAGRPPRATASTTRCSGVRAVRRRGPCRPARRREDRGGPGPARCRGAAGRGRRPHHDGHRRPRWPGDDGRGPGRAADATAGSPRRSSSASSWRTPSRGRLHVPAVGAPRARRTNPTGSARPGAAGPGQRRRRRDAHRDPRVAVSLTVNGPGDVMGLDPRVVVRTDPRPHSVDVEPNYLPLVEFDPPDLPWMFTPAASGPTIGCGRGACSSSSTSGSSQHRGPNRGCRYRCSRCPAPSWTPSSGPRGVVGLGAYPGGRPRRRGPRRGPGRTAGDERLADPRASAAATRTTVCGLPRPGLRRRGRPRARWRARRDPFAQPGMAGPRRWRRAPAGLLLVAVRDRIGRRRLRAAGQPAATVRRSRGGRR